MKGRRQWLLQCAGLAGASGLPLLGAGCRPVPESASESASEPATGVTLRFWAMGREGEVARELLAGFAQEHPQWRLRIDPLPWSAAHEKLLTAFAGDATPDVAQIGNTWMPEMTALGALTPLEPWLDATPAIGPADFFPGIWQTHRMDGRMMGLPWTVDTRLVYYRRDLFERLGLDGFPPDWSGWLAALRSLKARGWVRTPVLLPLTEFEPLLALALQDDRPLVSEDGHARFSGPGFRQALDFYLQLFREGLAPPATHNQIANLWQEFERGTFACFISGPWNMGELRRRLPASRQHLWAAAPLPGPRGPGFSTAGGSSLVLFERSRHKPQAWALIEYLSRPQVQQTLHRMTGNLPPRRSAWTLAGLTDDPAAQAFARQLERVRPAPALPEWERIANEMQLVAARLVHEGTPPAPALAALDARVNDILGKYRWMRARRRQAVVREGRVA